MFGGKVTRFCCLADDTKLCSHTNTKMIFDYFRKIVTFFYPHRKKEKSSYMSIVNSVNLMRKHKYNDLLYVYLFI